jgi:HAD superfamily hydrolase (TIGR01509 family)
MIDAIFFDLGKVIVDFDYFVGASALLKITPLSISEIVEILSDAALINEFETGSLSVMEYYHRASERLRIRVPLEAFQELWGSMFLPNPLVSEALLIALKKKHRLFLLSNTNEIHFRYVAERYPLLRHIEERILSFQVGCMKPDRKIFELAIRRAGVLPQEILFTDDRLDNIEAARACGIKAIQFSSEAQLIKDLQKLGISSD